MRSKARLLICALVMSVCAEAQAGDAFQIVATPTGGGAPVETTSSKLLPQLKDLIQTRGAYSGLAGQSFNATIRYGEIENALHVSENAAGTSATVSSRLSNLNQPFVAANSAALKSDVVDFIQKGSNGWSSYTAAMDAESVFGVIDGNPRAATAFLAEDAYFRWGQDASTEGTSRLGDNLTVRLDGSGGSLSAGGFGGNYYTAALGFDWQFSKVLGVALAVPFEYRELGGTNTYITGANFGIPITLIPMDWDGWGWRVTPFGSSWGAFSGSLAAGGFFATGGVVSSLRFRTGPLQATLIDQASYSGGIPISIANIDYETNVDQWLFKNGAQLAYAISTPLQLDASFVFSNYSRKAAVQQWWTVQTGVNYRFTNDSGIRVAYQGDFGPSYTSNGVNASLYLRF
jgi:hypothetical protein